MPSDDLKLLLDKDPIIFTCVADDLRAMPEQIAHTYEVYARTHIPLGDSPRYVDTICRWVGGRNQGAFIGAVAGANGQGKTSFQLHVWQAARGQGILAVPPFQAESVSQMVDGIAHWSEYVLRPTHAAHAEKVARLRKQYHEKSLREIAEETARQSGRDVNAVHDALIAAQGTGARVERETSPADLLDFLAKLTEVAQEAGYKGVLAMWDEPEVTARKVGQGRVAYILFELANGLGSRQGNYGLFVSVPETFLSYLQTAQPALPARLQHCQCFVRLGDLYGADFAPRLWARYCETFDIADNGRAIVTPEALEAIGQIGSSARADIGYGPRSVVSAFKRMVWRHAQKDGAYLPADLAQDCRDDEVMVQPDYKTRVNQALHSPEARGAEPSALLTLAAFPGGATEATLRRCGLNDSALTDLARRLGLVYRRAGVLGLDVLRPQTGGAARDDNALADLLTEIGSEFAPSPENLKRGMDTLVRDLLPTLFPKRTGQQTIGWDETASLAWVLVKGTRFATISGAWPQTRDYPFRRIALAVGPLEANPDTVQASAIDLNQPQDIILHLRLRWNPASELPAQRIETITGDPAAGKPDCLRGVLDLTGDPLSQARLRDILSDDQLRPLGWLYIIAAMSKRTLPHEVKAQWDAIKGAALTALLGAFFTEAALREQAAEIAGHTLTGGAPDVLPQVVRALLKKRLPDYSTLIKQPQWKQAVTEYVRVLQDQRIPRPAKRGQTPWTEDGDQVLRVFNTNRMNLPSCAVAGLDNLIAFENAGGRTGPITVTFKRHPMETRLMERIQENPSGRATFDRKECPYLRIEDALPLLMASGYNNEEIGLLVEIGRARETFRAAEYKGRQVLYCPPLDIEQMKAQLSEKRETLSAALEKFALVPGFSYSFDAESLAQKVAELHDENEYDDLASELNRVRAGADARLDSRFDALEGDLQTVEHKAQQEKSRLESINDLSALRNAIQGTSPWIESLLTYIVSNLKTNHDDLGKEYREALNAVGKVKRDVIGNRSGGSPAERAERLTQGFETLSDIQGKIADLLTRQHLFETQLRDLVQWRGGLLSRSDMLLAEVNELRADAESRELGNTLHAELENVWEDIRNHLADRNVNGLGDYRKFAAQFAAIGEKRREHLTQKQTGFNASKTALNDLLKDLDTAAELCREAFNPSDPGGCEERLRGEAAQSASKLREQALGEIKTQRRELRYARDILNRISGEQADPLIARLDQAEAALAGEVPDAAWIGRVLSEESEQERRGFKNALLEARLAPRDARRAVRDAMTSAEQPEPEGTSAQMLALVPERDPADLKLLVLGLLKESGREPATALDASLEALGILFRSGRVDIKVERRRR